MINKLLKNFILLIVLSLPAACLPIPQVIDGLEVRGEVLDNDTAKPLPGAVVKISCAEKLGTKKAVSDANGKFRVSWGSHLKLYRSFIYSKKERARRTLDGDFKKEGYEREEVEDTFSPRPDMKYIDFGVVYLEPKR